MNSLRTDSMPFSFIVLWQIRWRVSCQLATRVCWKSELSLNIMTYLHLTFPQYPEETSSQKIYSSISIYSSSYFLSILSEYVQGKRRMESGSIFLIPPPWLSTFSSGYRITLDPVWTDNIGKALKRALMSSSWWNSFIQYSEASSPSLILTVCFCETWNT